MEKDNIADLKVYRTNEVTSTPEVEKVVNRRKVINVPLLISLLLLATLIKILSFQHSWVEKYYSTGVYIYIGRFYRFLFGWVPLSVGDFVYGVAGGYVIMKVIYFFTLLKRKEITRRKLKRWTGKIAVIALVIYILFNANWGLNYNRLGIQHQLQLKAAGSHSNNELVFLTHLLVDKMNETRKQVGPNKVYPSYSIMFDKAREAYRNAETVYPFLHYQNQSIKRSYYGRVGNYLGFLGYYNPFTGESQLNLTQPKFVLPFVICHEMAHQLGYASESEANFVGYLTAIHSADPIFHYSAYFDLFGYANAELARKDSVKARENYLRLDTLVKEDFSKYREFYKKYNNPVEPFIKLFYDRYLKINQQAKGVKSYNQVVGLLLAYQKKFGKI